MEYKTILAIETSCDETSVAVMRDAEILSNVIFSQIDLHAKYGGVVPSIARLAHQEKLPLVFAEALEQAQIKIEDVDLIAVTQGPGLAIALEVGIKFAQELALKYNKPFLPVNHMAGHLWSATVEESRVNEEVDTSNVISLLVSGGHTEMILMKDGKEFQNIGKTIDDAVGESYDKVGHMLGLEYPGGPKVAKLAAESRDDLTFAQFNLNKGVYLQGENPKIGFAATLPLPMWNSPDLDLSLSGLKTAVKQLISQHADVSEKMSIGELAREKVEIKFADEICALFEEVVVRILLHKLEKAIEQNPHTKEIWLGGGVVANEYFQRSVASLAEKLSKVVRFPPRQLIGDNAGMIAVAAFWGLKNGVEPLIEKSEIENVDRKPSLAL